MFVFVCMAGVVQAGDDFSVYRGKIGNIPIVVELYNDPGSYSGNIAGRYFYTKYRKDLALSGSRDAQGNLVLTEGDEPVDDSDALASKEAIPVMVLRSSDQKIWQGEWRNGKGKSYPVVLSLVTVLPAATSPFMQQAYQHSRYEYLRHEGAEPVMTKQETVNGYGVEWWRDPLSGMTTFQLSRGYPAEQLTGLNAALREELWQEVLNYYRCMQGSDKGTYTEEMKINQLLPWVVSYVVSGSESCGSGYNSGVRSENLRASDAKSLKLSDLFWVAEPPLPDEESEPSDYGSSILPHWLAEQFPVMYPDKMLKTVKGAGGNTLCDYREPNIWLFPTWTLTAQGILFHPTFPASDSVCDDVTWAVVPWSVVKQHPGRLKDLPLP